ncbi:hypothetical protein EV191_106276 [Tamaricihabitans halophyticus]|uniref:DUF4829 domain-containing protein n=1 Tax=Tamaricihabitans halophyticus TaxID=1262583 RepID=A0A4R2QQT3_9PSEU|nr:hypothetical protein [Tamaricihabitans halophyticus]TCP52110.1 hypothetical protein EV191_106276 [Tamaricihabitans halophyticus]
MRAKHWLGIGLAALIGWLVLVTVQISQMPDPGAGSLAELRDRFDAALRDRDAEALRPLLDYPDDDSDSFAMSYLDKFEELGPEQVTVAITRRASGEPLLSVDGNTDTRAFRYLLAVTEDNQRWFITFTPPL